MLDHKIREIECREGEGERELEREKLRVKIWIILFMRYTKSIYTTIQDEVQLTTNKTENL